MSDSPQEKQVVHKTVDVLERIFTDHDFDTLLLQCRKRLIVTDSFFPSKVTHPNTVKEEGYVYSDSSGIRAVIFHYTHSSGKTVRSIKRLVTDDTDYRLQLVS